MVACPRYVRWTGLTICYRGRPVSFKGFLPPFVVPSDFFCRSNAYNEKGLPQDVISLGYLGAYSSRFMPDFEM